MKTDRQECLSYGVFQGVGGHRGREMVRMVLKGTDAGPGTDGRVELSRWAG